MLIEDCRVPAARPVSSSECTVPWKAALVVLQQVILFSQGCPSGGLDM